MDKHQLRDLITRVLKEADLYSKDAVELLMLTAATESNLGQYIRQVGGGPALGIFQMEPNTEADIWRNYLKYKPELRKDLTDIFPLGGFVGLEDLEYNLGYQIMITRIHYLRVPKPLPRADDIEGMANYYKRYFNTPLGKGTVKKAMKAYKKYCI